LQRTATASAGELHGTDAAPRALRVGVLEAVRPLVPALGGERDLAAVALALAARDPELRAEERRVAERGEVAGETPAELEAPGGGAAALHDQLVRRQRLAVATRLEVVVGRVADLVLFVRRNLPRRR